ncbi:glycoside hydrolase family 95 protein [uncultured Draconibacterium sp.]|uniref:glycoside hydrolase family 95 protein n=1 Tax=uncultured Draconibacterium sp. TaxID=1573823 RepID=UPI0032613918
MRLILITLLLGMLFMRCSTNADDRKKTNIWFDKPAKNWYEAIPIGNGSLAGMVYGGIESDTIKLNEETLWSGGPRDIQNHKAFKYLPQIRQLLLDNKNKEAEKLIDSTMLGPWNECYLPMGDLVIAHKAMNEVKEYKRELDMNNGIVSVNYSIGQVQYKREVFASFPDKAIVMRLTANQSQKLNFSASLGSLLHNEVNLLDNQIVLNGKAPKHAYPHYLGKKEAVYEDGYGMQFQMRLLVKNQGGEVVQEKGKLSVRNADEVELILTAVTSFNGFDKNPVSEGRDCNAICEQRTDLLEKQNYNQLKKRHVEDFSTLFNRVSIDLGKSSSDDLAISSRLAQYKPDEDPGLTALYFQFGRYLLISSSRPGKFAQPANLQGIWNKDLQPAWSANWTLNCNAQINYWAVETVNLSELHLPFIKMVQELSVDGAKTARNMYGAEGWIAHHNADIWRTTSPVGGSGLWAIYQVGGAWLCHHLWEHYEFTRDSDYLKEIYPVLKGAARFYLDNLQRDKDGFWVTNPSESFENLYRKPDGSVGWACVGATQDMQIIRDLFQNCQMAISKLGVDQELGKQIEKYSAELLPMRISPTNGQLQEWKDDWEPADPFSAQVAHGWGLAVGNQISSRETPELAAAFVKTLENRKPWEQYNCGSWVGSFSAKFWSRLGNGEMLQTVIDTHFQKAVSPNFTSHFSGYWQIDGNLGITASIAEMLLQSHTGEVVLLPALSSKYPSGEVKGLCARNGIEVDIKWKDGELLEATFYSPNSVECKVRYKNKLIALDLHAGKMHTVGNSSF